MQVAEFTSFGGPDDVRIRAVDDPEPSSGEVLLDVKACGLNRHDLWILKGELGATEDILPFISGAEVAGVVDAVGEGVDVEVGERVLLCGTLTCAACRHCREGPEILCEEGELFHGGLAEKALVDEARIDQGRLISLPEGVRMAQAATLQAAYATTWHAFRRAGVTAGDLVFVPGVTGAVGVAAIQLLDVLGGRSLGTSRSETKLDRVKDIGLDYGIHGSEPSKIEEEVLEVGQPDLMLNHLGGSFTGLGVRVLRRGGTMVVIGHTAGAMSEIDNRELYGSHIDILGSSAGTQHEIERLVEMVDADTLSPLIEREFPLQEVPRAFRAMENSEVVGNVVITP